MNLSNTTCGNPAVFLPATVPNEGYAILAGLGIGIVFVSVYIFCSNRYHRNAAKRMNEAHTEEEVVDETHEHNVAGESHFNASDESYMGNPTNMNMPRGPPPPGAAAPQQEELVSAAEATRRRMMREAPPPPPR